MSIEPVDLAYFSALFPELADTPEAQVTALNDPALNYVSEDVLGASARYGLALGIAHLVVLGKRIGGGPVTNETVGNLSETTAALPTDQALKMTSYGMRLIELGRILNGPPTLYVGAGGGMEQLPRPFGGPAPTWP